jgi:hypothetical protein
MLEKACLGSKDNRIYSVWLSIDVMGKEYPEVLAFEKSQVFHISEMNL